MRETSLLSLNGQYDALYLRNYATLQLKDGLTRIPGVGQATVFGAGDYAMRVWLDPTQLASRGLMASDIVTAIRPQNVSGGWPHHWCPAGRHAHRTPVARGPP